MTPIAALDYQGTHREPKHRDLIYVLHGPIGGHCHCGACIPDRPCPGRHCSEHTERGCGMTAPREAVIAALYRHSPTGNGCDFGGLVCSNPDHIFDALAAANLLAQPAADEAEGDEREALLYEVSSAMMLEPGPDADTVADAVLAAGFRRRDPDAGLRERVEAALDYDLRDKPGPNGEPTEPGAWRRGARHVAVRVKRALAADTPTPAPEGSGLGGGAA